MRRFFRRIRKILAIFGLDYLRTIRSLRSLPFYLKDLIDLKKQQKHTKNPFPFGTPFPCLEDRFRESGSARGDYFHQDLWVAQRIYRNKPKIHVDVGSRIDGFVAHIASFRQIEVIDLRARPRNITNISFSQCDLMKTLPDRYVNYCDSLSCLHALEHFGLGRYGDQVNYDGWLIGLQNLDKMLQDKGKLYLSVPIGKQRIEFNAHRVFSVASLMEHIQERYDIDMFSYVDDRGDLHENVEITDTEARNSFGCVYGCGIFELTKPPLQ